MAWYEKWLKEIRSRRDRPFTVREYLEMCIDLEAHETETHQSYAAAAKKEGKHEIARIFEDLAGGEDNFSERMKKVVKEWRSS